MEDIKFENVLKIKMETPSDNILLTLYIIKKLLNDNSLIQKFYEIMNKGNEIPTMLETCGNNTFAKIASCGYFYCYNGLPSKWSNNQKSDSNVVISFIENINTSSNTPENILKNFICYSNCIRGVSEEIINYWTSLIDNTIPDIFYTKMGEKYREEHEVVVPTIDINTDSFEIKDMEEYTKFIRDNRGLYARNGITIPSAIFNIRANTVSLLSPSQINDHINPDITNVDKFEHITQKEIIEIPGSRETVVENKTNEPEEIEDNYNEPEEENNNYLDNEPEEIEEIEDNYNEPEEENINNYLDNEPDISEDYEFDYNENIPEMNESVPENIPEMNESVPETPENESDDLLESMNDQIDNISENISTDYSFDDNENENENVNEINNDNDNENENVNDISTDYSFDNNEEFDNNDNDNDDVIENDISTDYSFENDNENNENVIENDISTDYSFDNDEEFGENNNNNDNENDISTDYSFDDNENNDISTDYSFDDDENY